MSRAGKFALVFLLIALVLWQTGAVSWFLARTVFRPDFSEEENGQGETPDENDQVFLPHDLTYQTQVLSEGLDIPWDLAFLPDGRMLVTERAGRVLILPEKKSVLEIPNVLHLGEGGLLGIAVDPDFGDNPYVYLYYTYRNGASIFNRLSRFTMTDDKLHSETVLVDDLPGAAIHNGGRIRFGSDGLLYVCTGDAAAPERAQDVADLAGKILRYKSDGSIPLDNPFPGSPVYSLGHRNPQGLGWHPVTGELFASEHGPTRMDEINRIEPGGNYGWPDVTCDQEHGDYLAPVACYSEFTLAPSGMDFLSLPDMDLVPLFVSGLRGNMVRRLDFTAAGELMGEASLFTEWGRIRLVLEHDQALYVLTNNRDGRGIPREGDDRLIRIEPRFPEAP